MLASKEGSQVYLFSKSVQVQDEGLRVRLVAGTLLNRLSTKMSHSLRAEVIDEDEPQQEAAMWTLM